MGAITTALIAISALGLGWLTMEMACKPCLEKGREAIDRNLNPDYDPDDDDNNNNQAPLIPASDPVDSSSSPPPPPKSV